MVKSYSLSNVYMLSSDPVTMKRSSGIKFEGRLSPKKRF